MNLNPSDSDTTVRKRPESGLAGSKLISLSQSDSESRQSQDLGAVTQQSGPKSVTEFQSAATILSRAPTVAADIDNDSLSDDHDRNPAKRESSFRVLNFYFLRLWHKNPILCNFIIYNVISDSILLTILNLLLALGFHYAKPKRRFGYHNINADSMTQSDSGSNDLKLDSQSDKYYYHYDLATDSRIPWFCKSHMDTALIDTWIDDENLLKRIKDEKNRKDMEIMDRRQVLYEYLSGYSYDSLGGSNNMNSINQNQIINMSLNQNNSNSNSTATAANTVEKLVAQNSDEYIHFATPIDHNSIGICLWSCPYFVPPINVFVIFFKRFIDIVPLVKFVTYLFWCVTGLPENLTFAVSCFFGGIFYILFRLPVFFDSDSIFLGWSWGKDNDGFLARITFPFFVISMSGLSMTGYRLRKRIWIQVLDLEGMSDEIDNLEGNKNLAQLRMIMDDHDDENLALKRQQTQFTVSSESTNQRFEMHTNEIDTKVMESQSSINTNRLSQIQPKAIVQLGHTHNEKNSVADTKSIVRSNHDDVKHENDSTINLDQNKPQKLDSQHIQEALTNTNSVVSSNVNTANTNLSASDDISNSNADSNFYFANNLLLLNAQYKNLPFKYYYLPYVRAFFPLTIYLLSIIHDIITSFDYKWKQLAGFLTLLIFILNITGGVPWIVLEKQILDNKNNKRLRINEFQSDDIKRKFKQKRMRLNDRIQNQNRNIAELNQYVNTGSIQSTIQSQTVVTDTVSNGNTTGSKGTTFRSATNSDQFVRIPLLIMAVFGSLKFQLMVGPWLYVLKSIFGSNQSVIIIANHMYIVVVISLQYMLYNIALCNREPSLSTILLLPPQLTAQVISSYLIFRLGINSLDFWISIVALVSFEAYRDSAWWYHVIQVIQSILGTTAKKKLQRIRKSESDSEGQLSNNHINDNTIVSAAKQSQKDLEEDILQTLRQNVTISYAIYRWNIFVGFVEIAANSCVFAFIITEFIFGKLWVYLSNNNSESGSRSENDFVFPIAYFLMRDEPEEIIKIGARTSLYRQPQTTDQQSIFNLNDNRSSSYGQKQQNFNNNENDIIAGGPQTGLYLHSYEYYLSEFQSPNNVVRVQYSNSEFFMKIIGFLIYLILEHQQVLWCRKWNSNKLTLEMELWLTAEAKRLKTHGRNRTAESNESNEQILQSNLVSGSYPIQSISESYYNSQSMSWSQSDSDSRSQSVSRTHDSVPVNNYMGQNLATSDRIKSLTQIRQKLNTRLYNQNLQTHTVRQTSKDSNQQQDSVIGFVPDPGQSHNITNTNDNIDSDKIPNVPRSIMNQNMNRSPNQGVLKNTSKVTISKEITAIDDDDFFFGLSSDKARNFLERGAVVMDANLAISGGQYNTNDINLNGRGLGHESDSCSDSQSKIKQLKQYYDGVDLEYDDQDEWGLKSQLAFSVQQQRSRVQTNRSHVFSEQSSTVTQSQNHIGSGKIQNLASQRPNLLQASVIGNSITQNSETMTDSLSQVNDHVSDNQNQKQILTKNGNGPSNKNNIDVNKPGPTSSTVIPRTKINSNRTIPGVKTRTSMNRIEMESEKRFAKSNPKQQADILIKEMENDSYHTFSRAHPSLWISAGAFGLMFALELLPLFLGRIYA